MLFFFSLSFLLSWEFPTLWEEKRHAVTFKMGIKVIRNPCCKNQQLCVAWKGMRKVRHKCGEADFPESSTRWINQVHKHLVCIFLLQNSFFKFLLFHKNTEASESVWGQIEGPSSSRFCLWQSHLEVILLFHPIQNYIIIIYSPQLLFPWHFFSAQCDPYPEKKFW